MATLTSSNLEDYASLAGEEMQERLSKVVGRTENIVTPVEGDDIFPILHRRLFTTIGTEEQRRAVADAYADWYESLGDAVPASYREASYRDRLATAYPFHPELVDILTNRWGSLSGFQRTRGALRTLAHTVKALSQRQSQGPAHPSRRRHARRSGHPRRGPSFRRGELQGCPQRRHHPSRLDGPGGGPAARRRRSKSFGLATGLATTAFLNSFGSDKVLGASAAQMLVGVGRPGLSRGLDRGRA